MGVHKTHLPNRTVGPEDQHQTAVDRSRLGLRGGALAKRRSLDREDYGRFLSAYGVSDNDVRRETNSGNYLSLSFDNIEVRKSDIHGKGLFGNWRFKTGQIIGPALLDGYKTQIARYANHAASPNARMVALDSENVVLVATRDIDNEEITTDYRESLQSRIIYE